MSNVTILKSIIAETSESQQKTIRAYLVWTLIGMLQEKQTSEDVGTLIKTAKLMDENSFADAFFCVDSLYQSMLRLHQIGSVEFGVVETIWGATQMDSDILRDVLKPDMNLLMPTNEKWSSKLEEHNVRERIAYNMMKHIVSKILKP